MSFREDEFCYNSQINIPDVKLTNKTVDKTPDTASNKPVDNIDVVPDSSVYVMSINNKDPATQPSATVEKLSSESKDAMSERIPHKSLFSQAALSDNRKERHPQTKYQSRSHRNNCDGRYCYRDYTENRMRGENRNQPSNHNELSNSKET